jgi:hypothetical protein
MYRGYRCAFILALVFACIPTTGCHSSSSTRLQVTTTSLPNGVIGVPYVASLTATGGTPGYTWSQTSGGTMPNGVSLGSSGVFNGTPTKAGTFGPYVFEVTDSASPSNTASSPSLSITVTDGSAVVAAACAPTGGESALTPSTPYAFLLKGTDGIGNPLDIAGSFTPNGEGGISSATVDYNDFSTGPEHLQVNLAASSYSFGSSASGCLSLTFSGAVADPVNTKHVGVSPYFAYAAVVRTKNGKTPAPATTAASRVQFAFTLGGFDGTLYHTGRIIASGNTGDTTNVSGLIHVQVPGAFSLASLQPNYAFGVDGWTAEPSGYFRSTIAGTFANSSGALSAGYADLNAGGTPSGELTGGKGTLNSAIDASTGRGTGTYTIPTPGGNLTFDFAFYILNKSDFILLSTDSPLSTGSAPLLSGRALASSATYAAGALSGDYLLASQGLERIGNGTANRAEIGTLNASRAGAIPNAILYVNDAGIYSRTPYSNGEYTLETASGRVSMTGLTTAPPVLYLTALGAPDDQIAGFLVGSDSQASSGLLLRQSTITPTYGLSTVSGIYVASTQEDLDGHNGAFLGSFASLRTGQYFATQNSTGSVPNLQSSGSITINPDGSGSLNSGAFPFVTNGALIFAIPDTGDPLLYVFTAGKLPD